MGTTKSNSIRLSDKKILIVDDKPESTRLITKILSCHGSCYTASNENEIFSSVESAFNDCVPFDMIVINMDIIDGVDVLRHIRRLEQHYGVIDSKKVQVIM